MYRLLFVLLFSTPLFANAQRTFQVEDMLRLKSIVDGSVSLSKDGNWIAYSVHSKDSWPRTDTTETYSQTGSLIENGKESDVWISNVRTGAAYNVTDGIGSNWAPVWSPNGSKLAFFFRIETGQLDYGYGIATPKNSNVLAAQSYVLIINSLFGLQMENG